VARDKAHARIEAMLKDGKPIPSYFTDHPVFYAGPTDPAPGAATGAFGPTTASRMDSYLEPFLKRGASLVTIAKGGRGKAAEEALAAAGGVGGAEGSVWLAISGEAAQENGAAALIQSVAQEPAFDL